MCWPLCQSLICYATFFNCSVESMTFSFHYLSPNPHQFTTIYYNAFKMHQKCTVLCHLDQVLFSCEYWLISHWFNFVRETKEMSVIIGWEFSWTFQRITINNFGFDWKQNYQIKIRRCESSFSKKLSKNMIIAGLDIVRWETRILKNILEWKGGE